MRTAPRKPAKQARSRAMVEAILDGAARVLRKDGYDRASTNRIAEVAGVSVGSLYQYFPSKEAVVSALYERHADFLLALLQHEFDAVRGQPVEAAVRRLVATFLHASGVDPKLRRVFVEQVPRVGKMDKRRAVETRVMALAEDFFGCSALTAFTIVGVVAAVTYEAAVNPRFPPDALVDELTAMVVGHLSRRRG